MKKRSSLIRNILFIIIFMAMSISLFIYIFFIKEQETVSLFENRNLATNEQFKTASFLDSSFQNALDDVLADQFYNRQKIVELKKKIDQDLSSIFYPLPKESALLTMIGDTNVYQIGNSKYMINGVMEYDEEVEKRILNRIEQINELAKDYPDIEFYLYRPIQGHETAIFDKENNLEGAGPHYNQLFKDNLNIPVSFLEYDTLEEYKELFYSSDHHWNYRGSYKGYQDIMKMMNMEDQILEVKAINDNKGAKFYGTFSSRTAYVLEPDDYYLYDIDYPDIPIYVFDSDKPVVDKINPKGYMANVNKYQDPHNYQYNLSYNTYRPYYVFKSNDESKENILVIGDSYAKAISYYLASAFNEAYFVNPADYFNYYYHNLDYDEFLKEHKIDKVLFMYTIENYFYTDPIWGSQYKIYDIVRSGK